MAMMYGEVAKLISVVVGIMTIAALSIGLEAYNKHPEYKEANKGSYDFVSLMLAATVLVVVYGMMLLFDGRFPGTFVGKTLRFINRM